MKKKTLKQSPQKKEFQNNKHIVVFKYKHMDAHTYKYTYMHTHNL